MMTPLGIKEKVVVEKVRWIDELLHAIESLPLGSYDEFIGDARNPAAADSYLRRALEALLDLGRHMLAKGLGRAVTEYREVARQLHAAGVLDPNAARLMGEMAGYRNRLVHFYDEVTREELFEICSKRLDDIRSVTDALTSWIRSHPDKVDHSL